jgi:glycosyltransferase involved in cell wall biosynthesis
MKIVLVTNMVAPYRVSFYNALAKKCDLTVLTDVASEFNRKWSLDASQFLFQHVVMQSRSVVLPRVRKDLEYAEQRQMHFSEKLWSYLTKIKPDLVVSNELGLRSLGCMLYCKFHDIPWILASEATNHTEGWVSWIKRTFRKTLISQADGFWSNGRETNQFLIDRGANASSIMPDMTGIDTHEFRQQAQLCALTRDKERSRLGLRGLVFLFAGRLESGKGLTPLMQAIRNRYMDLSGRASFLFVGNGSMAEEVRVLAEELKGIPFHFQGFVQPEELPRFFALGDIFLMPTLDDNWPLVNLEALAAGLPQLYSIFNGGMLDMNEIAGIGEPIDPRDVDLLGARLVECVSNPPARLECDRAFSLLEHYSPTSQAERAVRSVERVVGS